MKKIGLGIVFLIGVLFILGSGRAGPQVPDGEIVVTSFGVPAKDLKFNVFIPNDLPSLEVLRYKNIAEEIKSTKIHKLSFDRDNDVWLALMYGQDERMFTQKYSSTITPDTPRYASFAQGFSDGFSKTYNPAVAQSNALAAQRRRAIAEAAKKTNFLHIILYDAKTYTPIHKTEIEYRTSMLSFDELTPIFIKVFANSYGKNGVYKYNISDYVK